MELEHHDSVFIIYLLNKMTSKQPADTVPDNMGDLLYVKRYIEGKAKYCGYRRDYLVQNLTEFEKEISICKACEGIMKKASSERRNNLSVV